jgi:phosphohistidine phosphatase
MTEVPAYFYNQSGVIPYRMVNSKLEILLITSRKKRNWIIPKGIIDPGLSAEEAAKMEAFEEAGIEGDLFPVSIGDYKQRKWNGICHIKVFIFEVNRIFDNWPEEDLRERQWFDFDEAIALIKNKSLKAIIKNFPKYLKELSDKKELNA